MPVRCSALPFDRLAWQGTRAGAGRFIGDVVVAGEWLLFHCYADRPRSLTIVARYLVEFR